MQRAGINVLDKHDTIKARCIEGTDKKGNIIRAHNLADWLKDKKYEKHSNPPPPGKAAIFYAVRKSDKQAHVGFIDAHGDTVDTGAGSDFGDTQEYYY